jgi:DNA-binding IclR family transcriptional regulator
MPKHNSEKSAPPGQLELKSTSPAVVRAVQVLDAIAKASQALSLADLARETGFPKSTLHGLCETLAHMRLVKRQPSGAMALGPHVMTWASAFLSQTSITDEFQAMWAQSTVFADETVTLSVLDGPDVIYLACHNGNQPLGITFRPGMHLPAPYTATGKAMLSTLPPEVVTELLSEQWPQPLTKASVADFDTLSDELAQVRQTGYSVDNQQMREGMICFGAPVFDTSGTHAVAGLAVSFLTSEIDSRGGDRIGRDMRELADQLSVRLGASLKRF